jgi:DNA-binding NarL/FixJ family response regulator
MHIRADAHAEARSSGGRPPASSPVRVLVADDSRAFRRVARQVIELSPGFELTGTAATSEEAVELARTLRPHLVLVDVRMPRMGGIDAARAIAESSDASVVLISGSRREDTPGVSATDLPYLPKSSLGPAALRALWDELSEAVIRGEES